MLVVCNTSPISNLAIIDQLGLLKERYGSVVIPSRVKLELDALSHPQGRGRVEEALCQGWLRVKAQPDRRMSSQLEQHIDPGEAEAIALAEWLKADKLLIDDRIGRELARERQVPVAGLLGELLHAKQAGRLESVRHMMDQLRAQARFFIRADLRALVLQQAGESEA